MSIATEMTNLAANRDAIKAAIEAKGGTAASNTLAAFPAAIAALPSGGGGLVGHTVELYDDGSSEPDMVVIYDSATTEKLTTEGPVPQDGSIVRNGVVAVVRGTSVRFPSSDGERIGAVAPCFVEGTLVLLANGTEKPVERIGYGDELAAWDFDAGRMSSARPIWIKVAQESAYYWRTRFATGRELLTMGHSGHRVFSVDAAMFVYVTECVGHYVRLADGALDRVVETVRVQERCRYYNVITARHMNLYAEGVLTSFHLNNELYPFDARGMRFVKQRRALRQRREFPGVPDGWYEGLRLSEQTGTARDICEDIRMRLSVAAAGGGA